MVPVVGQRMFPSEIYLPLQGLFQSNKAGWKIYFLFWLLFHDLYNISVQTADGSGHLSVSADSGFSLLYNYNYLYW